jgi:hypothetical protein
MRNCMKRILKAGFVFGCVFALCLFGVSAYATYEPAKTPKIFDFSASRKNVSLGETFVLKWNVVNAEKIEITGLEKVPEDELPLSGSLEVLPMATTTYVLTATNAGKVTSKSITVNVDKVGNVSVDYFKASEMEVVSGDTFQLSWKTTNAKRVSIIGIEKGSEDSLPLEGSLEVLPTATTTYVLRAEGNNGEEASGSVTVNVIPGERAAIQSFTASKTEITKGETVTLKWNVAHAQSISIKKEAEANLSANGTLDVRPTADTTYVLEAVGTDKVVVTQSITVKVLDGPKITSFKATELSVTKGKLVTLSWTTTNATGCQLVTSDGITVKNRLANGSLSITPNKTKKYTLIAYDDKGRKDELTITITVK